MLASWLHLVALAVYVGSLVALWVILGRASSGTADPLEKARKLARSLKVYNPLQTGALGVMVFSGALQLTALKSAYRELFAKEFGAVLSVKLALAFVLVIFGIHQTMGVGHRFVRRLEAGEPVLPRDIASVTRRLRLSIPLLLLLTILTAWMGLRMR
jgi:uncharacterized membrane protein